MNEERLRVGIVGTGWVAGEHIAAWNKNPRAEVVALCSRTMAGAQEKAKELGLDLPCFTSMEKMIQAMHLDAVSLCSPNHLHCEQALLAAENRLHIVLEKPVALSLPELRRIEKAVKKSKVKTITGFVLRWNPLFQIIRSMLDDHAVGELFYGEVDYYHGIGPWYKQFSWNVKRKVGGSSLLSAGCHALDGLMWFMAEDVQEVTALSTKSKAPEFKPYQYDPCQVTILRFKNGKVGKVASSIDCKMPYFFNILLLGSAGTIRNNQVWSHKFDGQTKWAEIPTILPDSGDVNHHPFQGELDEFISAILDGGKISTGLDWTVKVHEVIFAADQSARTGKPVKLPLVV